MKLKFFFLILILLFFNSYYIQSYASPNQAYIIFRLDDCGIDDFSMYPDLFEIFNKNNVPLVVGVTPFKPDYQGNIIEIDSSIILFLKKYLKTDLIEIAQHGYIHLDNYKGDSKSEFYSVDYQKQFSQIKEGKIFLQNKLGVNIHTFIPPWNSYDSNTVKALINLKFYNLSAATYGKIQAPDYKINYVPYTAKPSWMNDIKSTIYRISEKNEGKKYLIVIIMHMTDFVKNSDTNSESSRKGMTLTEFSQNLSEIKSINNIHFLKFDEISDYFKDLNSSRLKSNIYFEDILPVYWILNFKAFIIMKILLI